MPSRGHIVPVRLADTSYDIRIEPGLISRAGETLSSLTQLRTVGVVADSNTAPLFGTSLTSALNEAGFRPIPVTIPAGENHKTLAELLPIYDKFLTARFERLTPLIALGGGMVGDMTGFLASTLLRGVPLIQMPTTLLAMVDASVGGKTGVNHPVGKNLIGSFHQPAAVLIDTESLRSLPAREMKSALAECIKHEVIRDADGFASLEANIDKVAALDMQYLTDLIAHNVRLKAGIVTADPFERGERAHLNFGHTFGHAIETVSKYAYTHGESVALGMIAAARVATALKMLDDASANRITSLIGRAGLRTGRMALDVDAIVEAMSYDKKVKHGKLRFILPDRIGHVVIRDDVPESVVRDAVHTLRGPEQ